MAGRDSSSKRKSSKKKRDKTSSQKKIRKRESKKASRIHDSDSEHTSSSASELDRKIRTRKNKKLRRTSSSSSEYRSLSSDTSSDYKRKKKARRSHVSLKSVKKQGRDRSSRPKDDGEANSSRKKRKRSSRDSVDKAVKKSSKRKKPKKCSSSSSSQTNSIESYEARKRRQLRSPSVSHVPSDGELLPVNNDIIIINNNSRRLRSVIAVVDHQQYDEAENRWDPHKEEIMYDPNDFPSPKSLDSNEEEIGMELDNQSFYESRYNEFALDNDGDRQLGLDDMNSNFEKEKDIDTPVPVSALDSDALESILRQKALENLKKFKGSLQTDGTSTHSKLNKESNVDMPSDVMVGKELIEQGTSNSQETDLNSGPAEKSDISEDKKLSGSENVGEESRLDTCPGGEITDVGSNSIAELSPSSRLEGENEAKDGSEFKEKTMSVMRGGEMVQVSYKVYIPKKSPALGRKTLRR